MKHLYFHAQQKYLRIENRHFRIKNCAVYSVQNAAQKMLYDFFYYKNMYLSYLRLIILCLETLLEAKCLAVFSSLTAETACNGGFCFNISAKDNVSLMPLPPVPQGEDSFTFRSFSSFLPATSSFLPVTFSFLPATSLVDGVWSVLPPCKLFAATDLEN